MTRAIVILAAALTAGSAGCGNTSVASNPSSSRPALPEKPTALPSQLSAKADSSARAPDAADILTVLSVEHQVDLSTELDGVVISIAKDEGSSVQAGDILGQLDDRSLKLELVKARDDLRVAQNNVTYREAELNAKRKLLERQKQLRQMGLSSQSELDADDFEVKGAEYALRGGEAQAESSEAEIHRIELLDDKTRLRAPFAGVVARRYVREGQTVSKNEKCFRVSQLYPLQVQFQVPETSGRRPEIGAFVEVFLVENPKVPLAAHIVKIGPTVDPASDSYNVTARLGEAKSSHLRPGMAARVSWPATDHKMP
jgi:membrane fusion protein (multidrug efflux system)